MKAALIAKGMVPDENHHLMLRKQVDGVTTVVTRMSHNDQDIRGALASLMARQCYLQAPEFWDLIDCPLSQRDWEQKIKERSVGGRNPYIGQQSRMAGNRSPGQGVPLSVDLGLAGRSERYDLARHLDRAAEAAPPPAAAVLASLAATARTDNGPLTADAAGLDTAGRQAVREALTGLLATAQANGYPDPDVLMHVLAGWDEWVRLT